MATTPKPDTIIIDDKEYSLSHIKDLSVSIDLVLSNGETRSVTVNIFCTNHVYSRKLKDVDEQLLNEYKKKGSLLTSYQYKKGNPDDLALRQNAPIEKEKRIFDTEKYKSSFYIPRFFKAPQETLKNRCILANKGDDKTCFSCMFELDDLDEGYAFLLMFKLTKISGNTINLLIETAYIEQIEKDNRLQKIKKITKSSRDELRPLSVLLKNILEGRKAFETARFSKRTRRRKKNKQKK
ncbi:hypothetical protein [Celerinatantimonas sp. MCCC 1A17872]|uniref:hypothetical protein n=1 Tax=Celerinatantimonas sp. MCCC 1A17872 TaxID=3177514 RepID=UPI0038BF9BEE